MLGKTAGGIFWMFRYLERSENTARLIDAGLRIALTRSRGSSDEEWRSLIVTAGSEVEYEARHEHYDAAGVVDFLLRDKQNPQSVLSMIATARNNARLVRTALTREVWEAVNESWMTLKETMARPIREPELPAILGQIRRQSALVRGALHGTMLRNDIYNFARAGTFIERADNTARILDVKYYVLLPSVSMVGSTLDNVQWDNILRSVSAQRAFRWLNGSDANALSIAEFLILDRRFPRSLAFCQNKLRENLGHLAEDYGIRMPSYDTAEKMRDQLKTRTIKSIFEGGLHEFIGEFVALNYALGQQIERDYRFYE